MIAELRLEPISHISTAVGSVGWSHILRHVFETPIQENDIRTCYPRPTQRILVTSKHYSGQERFWNLYMGDINVARLHLLRAETTAEDDLYSLSVNEGRVTDSVKDITFKHQLHPWFNGKRFSLDTVSDFEATGRFMSVNQLRHEMNGFMKCPQMKPFQKQFAFVIQELTLHKFRLRVKFPNEIPPVKKGEITSMLSLCDAFVRFSEEVEKLLVTYLQRAFPSMKIVLYPHVSEDGKKTWKYCTTILRAILTNDTFQRKFVCDSLDKYNHILLNKTNAVSDLIHDAKTFATEALREFSNMFPEYPPLTVQEIINPWLKKKGLVDNHAQSCKDMCDALKKTSSSLSLDDLYIKWCEVAKYHTSFVELLDALSKDVEDDKNTSEGLLVQFGMNSVGEKLLMLAGVIPPLLSLDHNCTPLDAS